MADVCDALLAWRPYRPGLEPERVLSIMGREVGTAIEPECFGALRQVLSSTTDPAASRVPAARIVATLAEDYHQAA